MADTVKIIEAHSIEEQYTRMLERAQQDYVASAMFPDTKIVWKGFINDEFSFIVIGFDEERSFSLELRIKAYSVFVLFATIEGNEATIFEIEERHPNYLPLTTHFLNQLLEHMKKENIHTIVAPLWEHNRQLFEYFEALEFTEVYNPPIENANKAIQQNIARWYQKVLIPAIV
jgi:hypothetical protein